MTSTTPSRAHEKQARSTGWGGLLLGRVILGIGALVIAGVRALIKGAGHAGGHLLSHPGTLLVHAFHSSGHAGQHRGHLAAVLIFLAVVTVLILLVRVGVKFTTTRRGRQMGRPATRRL